MIAAKVDMKEFPKCCQDCKYIVVGVDEVKDVRKEYCLIAKTFIPTKNVVDHRPEFCPLFEADKECSAEK